MSGYGRERGRSNGQEQSSRRARSSSPSRSQSRNYRERAPQGSHQRPRDHRNTQGDRGRQPYRAYGRAAGEGIQDQGPSEDSFDPLPESAPFPTGTGASIPYPGLPVRGTVGLKVMAYVNHHVIETLPLPANPIYAYDLRFKVPVSSQLRGSDKVSSSQMARVLLDTTLVGLLGASFVFDGVSLGWSPDAIVPLGQIRTTIVSIGVRRDGKPNEVEISVRNREVLNIGSIIHYLREGDIPINPRDQPLLENCLKWLGAVYREDPASRMVSRPGGDAFFSRSAATSVVLQSTGGVLEALRGVSSTVQCRFGRLTINVDICTAPFYVAGLCLVTAIKALVGCSGNLEAEFLHNQGRWFQAASKCLGMYFNVRHLHASRNERKIKFLAWSQADALTSTFEEKIDGTEETRTTSVFKYFQSKYNITLQYPRLPLARTRDGEFPLELCFSSPGERYKEPLQGPETADFIKFATVPATIRRQQINSKLEMLAWHNLAKPRAHGLSVNPKMMQVKARILPPPQLLYGEKISMEPKDGQWNLRGLRLLKPKCINSWALIYFPVGRPLDEAAVIDFGVEIMKGFRTVGMGIPKYPPSILMGNPQGDIKEIISNAISVGSRDFGQPPDLIFVLLQGAAAATIYGPIKKVLDCLVGIPSQAMLVEKAMRGKGQAQYVGNISLKVNVKLGGTNHTVYEPLFKAKRYMLIGGDISHPSPSALRMNPPPPSTAALAATYDKDCTAYTCVASMQATGVNFIEHIQPMMRELLERYKKKNNGLLPERIIYYRDGVSDSEVKGLLEAEGRPFKALCQQATPPIQATLIVAVKRHHTRFFIDGPLATRLGNVPCGFVAESSKDSFYLTPHKDLQGTKKPTRYDCLKDDSNHSPDELQRITFNSCSSYARATMSVSLVPAIFYADQACERARIQLQDGPDNTQTLLEVHRNLQWNMYWQ